jgi:hypothetical protein
MLRAIEVRRCSRSGVGVSQPVHFHKFSAHDVQPLLPVLGVDICVSFDTKSYGIDIGGKVQGQLGSEAGLAAVGGSTAAAAE